MKVDVVIFCLGFNLSVMRRAYAHNLWVGVGGSMWDLERGALIFIQNI